MAQQATKLSKKLINRPEDCVDENLTGFTALHPDVRQLAGHPRIIVRADLLEHKAKGRVAVLTGGGSGHEPAFCGLSLSLFPLAQPCMCARPGPQIVFTTSFKVRTVVCF